MTTSNRFQETTARLREVFPDPKCALIHANPYELLIATILSAQCTDVRVNIVTPPLFKAFPTTQALAQAPIEEVKEFIKSINFFNNKTKFLIGSAQKIEQDFGGEVPQTLEELITLPGVSRKTANVVLSNAFGINEGVVVDTHVGRIAQRLGLTKHSDPVKIEQDLMKLCPQDEWGILSHLYVLHGRATCKARKPACRECQLVDICPSAKKILTINCHSKE